MKRIEIWYIGMCVYIISHHALSLVVSDLLNRMNYVRPSVHQMKLTEEPYYLLLSNW